jgi:hypothetical protein
MIVRPRNLAAPGALARRCLSADRARIGAPSTLERSQRSRRAWRGAPYVLGLVLAVPGEIHAQHQVNDVLSWNALLRTGFTTRQRDDRDGSKETSSDFRLRLQAGLGVQLDPAVEVKVRFAGRLSTDQDGLRFSIPDHVPETDGLRQGESTLDELQVTFRPDDRWTIRLGRLQTKFERAGIVRKSLDRNDSPNFDVTWTDGAHVTYGGPSGRVVHAILQHNSRHGPTNVLRAPLEFGAPWSRVTIFAGIESSEPWGPVVHRGLDLTYIPRSLVGNSTDDGRPGDYVAMAGRGALEWPALRPGTRLMLSGELGYAPRTPTKVAAGTGGAGEGKAGGLAYEASVHLFDPAPDHSFGFAIGWIDDGWLISPDYRSNNFQAELRYRWQIHERLYFEWRIRTRDDRQLVTGALKKREDTDLYFRLTYRM